MGGIRQLDDPDRGSVTLWIVIFAVAVIALALLLADGGSLISAKERAADIAEQSARAAADDISVTSLRNNIVQINPDACQRAGNLVARYRLSPRMSAAMSSCDIQAQQATVTVSVAITPLIPGFTGSMTKAVTATAKPECGITQGGACP
jgi:Flp pilus assembly protein TadG